MPIKGVRERIPASKARILLVNDHLGWDGQVHGVGRLLQLWATHLDSARYDVTVCILGQRDSLSSILEDRGVKTVFLGKGKYSPSTVLELVRLIRKEKANLLHLQGYRGTTFGRLAGKITGTPVVVHFHDTVDYYPWVQRLSDRLLGRFTEAYLAVSDTTASFWAGRCRINPHDVTVIPNCVPLNELRPLDRRELEAERKRLGISPGVKVVGTIARLHEYKGIKYLLQAAPAVLKAFPNTVFLVVGDGPLRQELEELVVHLGLQDKVKFTGYVKNVAPVLGVLDIKVLPSVHQEGFGLAILEAMAMGKPIIVTDAVEIIEDGVSGLVVPPWESSALAEKILYLLSNDDEARRMGQNALQISARYDVGENIKRLEEVYDSLLDSWAAPQSKGGLDGVGCGGPGDSVGLRK